MRRLLLPLLLLAVGGCTVHPPGEREERDAALRQERFLSEPPPPLPDNPTPDQLVQYALQGNADVQRQYWAWRAAIEQIPQDATQGATVNLSAGTTITRGRANLASSTLALSNDPMTDLKWPGKLDAAARQDLEIARAAGRRYFGARYALRDKVLDAYYDYCLTSRLLQLEQRNQQLLRFTASATQSRNRAGTAGQQDVLKAENEADLSQNGLANMASQLPGQRAAINALLGRAAEAPLAVPSDLPASRPLAYADAELLSLASHRNPELAALADETSGRDVGVQLARLQYIPDFNLSAGSDLMGISQSILGQMTFPIFRHEALDAAIAQAQDNLLASRAMRRQTASDLSATVIADLATIRDADRQLDLFEHTILPRASQIVEVGQSAFENGQLSLLELLDDQRSLISIQRLVANLQITRAKSLADLETITATDLSRRNSDTTQPSPPVRDQTGR